MWYQRPGWSCVMLGGAQGGSSAASAIGLHGLRIALIGCLARRKISGVPAARQDTNSPRLCRRHRAVVLGRGRSD